MNESEIQEHIRAVLNTGRTRAWRNNIAKAQVHGGRWVNFGIPGPGGSDLIGLHSIIIEPHHVGKRMAVFLAVEVKSATGKPTADQVNFIKFITSMGGLAGIARSAEDAKSIVLSSCL